MARAAQPERSDLGTARPLGTVPEPELRPAPVARVLPMARNDLLVEAKRRPDDRSQPGRRPRTANRRPHRAHGPVRREGRVVRIGRPDRSAGDRFGVADDGIDAVAVAQSVVQALQNQGGRALTRWGRPGHLVRREHGAHVSRQIDRTDDGRIEFFQLQPARCDLQRLCSRCLVAGDRKARPADPELAGNPAGHQPAQRAHRPVRGERRTDRLPQRIDPALQLRLGKAQVEFPVPDGGLIGEPPAKLIVVGVLIQPQADHDARPAAETTTPPGVRDGLGRDRQHQRLLGQHLLELRGGMRNWSTRKRTASR